MAYMCCLTHLVPPEGATQLCFCLGREKRKGQAGPLGAWQESRSIPPVPVWTQEPRRLPHCKALFRGPDLHFPGGRAGAFLRQPCSRDPDTDPHPKPPNPFHLPRPRGGVRPVLTLLSIPSLFFFRLLLQSCKPPPPSPRRLFLGLFSLVKHVQTTGPTGRASPPGCPACPKAGTTPSALALQVQSVRPAPPRSSARMSLGCAPFTWKAPMLRSPEIHLRCPLLHEASDLPNKSHLSP